MPAPQADFRRIKQRIPMDAVLARYGVKLRSVGPHTLCGPCPLPTHTSRNRRDSFSVNLSRQVWSCHSDSCIAARGGRLGGHVIDLVAILERCSLHQAGLWLQDWFGGVLTAHPAPLPPVAVETSTTQPNRPLGFALQGIDTRHRYLTRRGISPVTARWFGVGMYQGAGFLAGRCVIPIRDQNSQLVAYAGRAVNGEEPKYRFPAGFRKSQVLFNLDRATGGNEVIVVEGFFDALKVHQAGHPAVVALMGSSFSQRQSELLLSHFASVTVMLDGDDPGRHAAEVIAKLLRPKVRVHQVELPNGVQPDQLSSLEINALIGPSNPTS